MPPPDDMYYEALDRLIRPLAAARLPGSLDAMRALLAALGHPEGRYPVVVVAGSTGKGTTALRLAAGLASGGLRVGLYTSPHLHSFRERFAVLARVPHAPPRSPSQAARTGVSAAPAPHAEGEEQAAQTSIISPAAFTSHARAVLDAAAGQGFSPSTFESATALAFHWFAEQPLDIAVCEIGLGGRFDAVNAAPHCLALIGPIEREHAAMLGGTLERIAGHKAGVITPGTAAIAVRPDDPAVRGVLEDEAALHGAALTYADDLAAAGLRWLQAHQFAPAQAAVPAGVALPGRLERGTAHGRRVLVDGGHTPLAARRLAAALAPDLPDGVRLIAGLLADKDAVAWLRELDLPGVTLVLTTPPADRARPAEALAAAFTAQSARVEIEPSFDAALARAYAADEGVIAVAGSLRLAAAAREAFGWLDDDALAEARRTRALFEGPGYRARWNG